MESVKIQKKTSEIKAIFDDAKFNSQHIQWNGLFVYGFDKDGFIEKGSIYYSAGNNYNSIYIPVRSLYIGDYTVYSMDGSIKMNDLTDISNDINRITIESTAGLATHINK